MAETLNIVSSFVLIFASMFHNHFSGALALKPKVKNIISHYKSTGVNIEKHFQRDWKPKDFPVITNLEKMLKPFKSDKCLWFVDNPSMINLPSSTSQIPRIMRTFSLKLKSVPSPYKANRVQTIHSWTRLNKHKSPFVCKQSLRSVSFGKQCDRIELSLEHFSSFTKPWNCLLILELFPLPLDYKAAFNYPPAFRNYAWKPYEHAIYLMIEMQTSVPKTLSRLEILFQSYVGTMDTSDVYNLRSQNMFLICGVKLVNERKLEETKGNVETVTIHSFYNDDYFKLSIRQWISFGPISLLMETAFPSQANLVWGMPNYRFALRPLAVSLFKCEKVNLGERMSRLRKSSDVVSEAFDIYTSILLSTMGNYSFRIGTSRDICTPFGLRYNILDEHWRTTELLVIKLDVLKYDNSDYSAADLKINFTSKSLRFVSCGKKLVTQYPFEELLNVFDIWIWIWLGLIVALVFFCMPIIFSEDFMSLLISYKETLGFLHLIGIVKVLLEQGDPFTDKLVKPLKSRFMLGSVLLVGIVLSNAYKNTNVYNLIAPRARMPFDNFSQLIDNKFRVYTRSEIVKFASGKLTLRAEIFLKSTHEISYPSGAILLSEISNVWKVFSSKQHLNHTRKKLIDTVFNETALHPEVIEAFEKNKNAAGPVNVFRYLEQQVLFKELRKCDNVAIILPTYMCSMYARYFRGFGEHGLPADVSSEVYTMETFSINVNGFVPPQVFSRLNGLRASNIVNWWTKFLEKERLPEMQVLLEPPAMKGNILVIFLIWSAGQVIAIVLFVIEIKSLVGKLIFIAWQLIKFVAIFIKTYSTRSNRVKKY